MYLLFVILPLFLIIPLAIYFYFYFRRILSFFSIDINKRQFKIILTIATMIFVLPAFNLFSMWALILLHLFAFSLIIEIIHRFVKNKEGYFEKFYRIGVIPVLCTALILGYGYMKMEDVRVKEYTIETDKNIQQEYKVAFLSDLHFGNTMNQEKLQQYCHDISQYHPDIVVLGGDIVDERCTKKQMQQAFETLGTISSQYGIYYVYGNHDRATFLSNPLFTKDELATSIQDNHITIVSDDIIRVNDDFILVGREDRRTDRKSSEELMISNQRSQAFRLMVDHQPVDFQINDYLGYDLQLSGHTHGGQVFPVGLFIDFLGFGEMNYGYKKLNHMQVIVSSGIAGWGYPIRTGSDSEYLIIHIKNSRN